MGHVYQLFIVMLMCTRWPASVSHDYPREEFWRDHEASHCVEMNRVVNKS